MPGRAGLQPGLRITYEGGMGNGVVGIGWGLSLPSIKRQADKGFPRLNSNNTFLLGGEELVPLSNPEHDWRTENERSFSRARQLPTQNAWEVTDRTGTRHLYGQFRAENGRWSAVIHPDLTPAQGSDFDRTYCWMLKTTIDLHGNRVEYVYTPALGLFYVSRVTYSHFNGNYHEVRRRLGCPHLGL